MDYVNLRVLIETHPTHAATSDRDMATWLNEAGTVTRNRATMSTEELVQVAVSYPADYAALSVDKRDALLLVVSGVDTFSLVNGTPVRELLEIVFAGTDIFTELASRLTEDVSRAVDAGFNGRIREGDVTVARTA